MKEYEVTQTERFRLDSDQIAVEYSDLESGWHWRLRVNSEATSWSGIHTDLLFLKGYCVASEYYDGFTPWQPFYMTYATEDKS